MSGAGWEIRTTDVMAGLRAMPDACVQVCATSPPYFNLRAYSTNPQIWGGDPNCPHTLEDDPARRPMTGGTGESSARQLRNNGSQFGNAWASEPGKRVVGRLDDKGSNMERRAAEHGSGTAKITGERYAGHGATCTICGAWRGELGSESSPALFVSHLVEVFREVRRVLHPTGLLVVNLGDSYAGSGKGPTGHNGLGDQAQRQGFTNQRSGGAVPAKSLYLIPERFALAMLDDGWIVRSRLAGVKVAPMPESCRDRPTSAWEHVYLFSKQARYFWDQDAVRTEHTRLWDERNGGSWAHASRTDEDALTKGSAAVHRGKGYPLPNPAGANMRNWFYWPPANFAGAHFATFPVSVPEIFIKAGTSSAGQCPEPNCGKPWQRVVERVRTGRGHTASQLTDGGIRQSGNDRCSARSMSEKRQAYRKELGLEGPPPPVTTGWASSCQCQTDQPPVPQLVLDCFSGSGTSVLVANRLGRRGLGLELNEKYAADSRNRIQNDAPLVHAINDAPPSGQGKQEMEW